MPRESKAARQARAVAASDRINALYPHAECALTHPESPFHYVIEVLLSAQTTDAAVNKVTPELFRRWPTAYEMAEADPAEIEDVIRSIGFFRSKARHCVGCAQMVVADFGGELPHTMEELTRLPGVGRKTANLVLNDCFGITEGVAVDTHVFRIASRLGLTRAPSPAEAEKDLIALYNTEQLARLNHQWVLFGREVCDARKPRCAECPLQGICPSAFKDPLTKEQAAKKAAQAKKAAAKRRAARAAAKKEDK
jgi:endonuclease-3